jgi:hypothetical protein
MAFNSTLGRFIIPLVVQADRNSTAKAFDEVGSQITRSAAALGFIGNALYNSITKPMIELGAAAVSTAGDFEMMRIGFAGMMDGNIAKADEMIAKIRDLAVKTPYETKGIAQGMQMMMAQGSMDADQAFEYSKKVADLARGSSQGYESIARNLSQAKGFGKLMTIDYREMVRAGFNPLARMNRELAKSLVAEGMTQEEATSKASAHNLGLLEKGLLSWDVLKREIDAATGKGGSHFGAATAAESSYVGQMNALREKWQITLQEIGDQFLPIVKPIQKVLMKMMDGLVKAVKWVTSASLWIKVPLMIVLGIIMAIPVILMGIAGLLGTIGTALMTVSAIMMIAKLGMLGFLAPLWSAVAGAWSFAAGIMAATWPFWLIVGVVLILIGLINLLADDFYAWQTGGISVFGDWYQAIVDLNNILDIMFDDLFTDWDNFCKAVTDNPIIKAITGVVTGADKGLTWIADRIMGVPENVAAPRGNRTATTTVGMGGVNVYIGGTDATSADISNAVYGGVSDVFNATRQNNQPTTGGSPYGWGFP